MKVMLKAMHKNSGFSFMELMTVIALIGLLTAIAIPNMIGWRSGAKLRGAVDTLRGDLQWAKLKAVQENAFVALSFSENDYLIFTDIDDGANGPGEFIDGTPGEDQLKSRQLDANVSIDLGSTDFNGNDYVRFNNRGLPVDGGTIVINSSDGEQRTIDLNRLGRINIQ
jgi:type IV fimbrial biogenesis protein FimT